MKKYLTPTYGLLCLCLALFVLLALRKDTDYDIGFHLKGGQWIVQNHSVPHTDTFTYTATGHPYVDIHWLYQLVLYGLYRLGGYGMLTLFNAGLAALLFFLLSKRLWIAPWPEGAPFWLALTALGIECRFLLRPEVLSWVLLTLTLLILDGRFWRRWNYLKVLPVIHLFWANTHGLFVLGWFAIGAYLLSGFLRDRRWDKPLALALLASVLVTLVNPNFIQGTLYPFLTQVSLQNENIFRKTIAELTPPLSSAAQALYPDAPLFLVIYKGLLVITPCAALICWKKLWIHEWILLAVFGFLSTLALRNMPLFILAAVPILARLVPEIRWDRRITLAAQACLGIFLAATLARVCHNAYYVDNSNPAEFGLGLEESFLPVKAADFMRTHRLDGRMINSNVFGGWLEWEGFQSSMDGRVEAMGEDLFSGYVDSFKPGGLMQLAEKYDASMIVADHATDTAWVLQMVQEPDWRLVYFDEDAAIYLKKNTRPDLPEADFQSVTALHPLKAMDDAEVEGLLREPRSSWWSVFMEGILREREHPTRLLQLANFTYHYRQYDLTERLLLEALRLTGGRSYAIYNALSRDYLTTHQWRRAQWSLEKALEFGRDEVMLKRALAAIPDNPQNDN